MGKKRAKASIGRRYKTGKNLTKVQIAAQIAAQATPLTLPKAPDAVNTVPPSPKRRKAAIAGE